MSTTEESKQSKEFIQKLEGSIEKLKEVTRNPAIATANLHQKKQTLAAIVHLASELIIYSNYHTPKAQALIEQLSGQHFDAYQYLMKELTGADTIQGQLDFAKKQETFGHDIALAIENFHQEIVDFSQSSENVSPENPMQKCTLIRLIIGTNLRILVELPSESTTTQALLENFGWAKRTALKTILSLKGVNYDDLSKVATMFEPLEDSLTKWSESAMEKIIQVRPDSGLGEETHHEASHLEPRGDNHDEPTQEIKEKSPRV